MVPALPTGCARADVEQIIRVGVSHLAGFVAAGLARIPGGRSGPLCLTWNFPRARVAKMKWRRTPAVTSPAFI
jgi:hypothetical protein